MACWRSTADMISESLEKDVERDFIMSAEQAKEYGLIDEIITKHK